MTRPSQSQRSLAPALGWSLPFALALPLALPLAAAQAQDPQLRVRTFERPLAIAMGAATNPNRAVIGVGLTTGTRADTAGLEITDVTAEGPAAKAGLAAGARLEAINGVSLRISADDAADPLTADAGFRRLQRELDKVKPGEVVELRVREGSASRTVRVTTVAERELQRARVATIAPALRGTRKALEERAALGLSLASAGNARDTLGVFITNVVTGGPADRSGIAEGDRIAAVNGVDVRVPAEDAGDPQAGQARVARLQREVARAKPGDVLTLRVYTGGRYRDVTVTAGKASEVGTGGYRFEFRSGPEGPLVPSPMRLEGERMERELLGRLAPLLETRPRAPAAPTAPRRSVRAIML